MTAPSNGKTMGTLMIVEDEALVAMTLRDELEGAGYKVLDLTDRHVEALAVARAEKPNLALVNIRLAGGDDGIELAEQLRAWKIPVLLISGQVSRARSAQTVAVGSMPQAVCRGRYGAGSLLSSCAPSRRRLAAKAPPIGSVRRTRFRSCSGSLTEVRAEPNLDEQRQSAATPGRSRQSYSDSGIQRVDSLRISRRAILGWSTLLLI